MAEPLPPEVGRLVPEERSVLVQPLEDGQWLVTETRITRRVQPDMPRFEVVDQKE